MSQSRFSVMSFLQPLGRARRPTSHPSRSSWGASWTYARPSFTDPMNPPPAVASTSRTPAKDLTSSAMARSIFCRSRLQASRFRARGRAVASSAASRR